MQKDVIYLDYNATTPCDPRVVEAMLPFFSDTFANPSSRAHRPGQAAGAALEAARQTIACSLGARSSTEITFTAGATEANNLAIHGVTNANASRGRHLITQATEHPAVLEPMRHLEKQGWELTVLGVDRSGRIRLDELEQAIRDDTVLVSLMLANNETGSIQPVREAAVLAHARGAFFHCDAAQGIGKIAVDVKDLEVDLLSLSAHKLYGPKGTGVLYIRRTRPPLKLSPQLYGGGQEGGLRSGTSNLPGAAGLARALEIVRAEIADEGPRITTLRDRFEGDLLDSLENCIVNGDADQRLPGTSNISLRGIEISALLASLPDLALSSGSACTSSHPEPSPVLRAMGVSRELAITSMRISLGRFTTETQVDRAVMRIAEEVSRLMRLGRR